MKHSFLYDSLYGGYSKIEYPFLKDVVVEQIAAGVKPIATFKLGNMYARAAISGMAQQFSQQPVFSAQTQPSITPYENITPTATPTATPTKVKVSTPLTPTSSAPSTPTQTRPTSVAVPQTPLATVENAREVAATIATDVKKGPSVETVDTATEELYKKMRETIAPLSKEDLASISANAADPFKDRSKYVYDKKPALRGEIEAVSMLSGIDSKRVIPNRLEDPIYPYIVVENPGKADAKVVFGNVSATAIEKYFDKVEGSIQNMLYSPVRVVNKQTVIDTTAAAKLTRPSLDNQIEAYQSLGKMFTVEGKDSKKQYGIYVREIKLGDLNTVAVEDAKRLRIALGERKPGTPKKGTPNNSPKRTNAKK